MLVQTISFGQSFNEICASNTKVHEDFFVGYLDWIEIINSTDETVSFDGYSLSNQADQPGKWYFPPYSLSSGSYLTITASKTPVIPQTINFPFPRNGGAVYLFDPTNELIDSIVYPLLHPNHSYGKIGGDFYYFDTPTPGAVNSEAIGYKGYANAPIVNLESGKYTTGTSLEIAPVHEAETIYYSLNGINPQAAFLYEAPLVLNQNTSIRAISIADSLLPSESVYRSYFVGATHSLPVINISADSVELFDLNHGIFMMGPDAVDTPPHLGANFWKDQEAHIYFEYFEDDFHLRAAMDCHIEIYGGIGSRWRAMKSVQLRGKNTYEPSRFSLPYFDEKEIDSFKRLVLRNGGNDFCNSGMKDAALHQYFIESKLNVDFLAYSPVVVYINGHYIGVQNLREKADRFYIESNYGIDPNSVNLLAQATLDVVDGDAADFIEMKNYAVANNLDDPTHYNWMDERLDLSSFVDYFIVQLFVNNRDWPNFNLKVWNAAEHKKWRYLCYDMDAGLKYNSDDLMEYRSLTYILNNFSETNPHVQILSELLENKEFRRDFINRYCDLLNTVFDPEPMMKSILQQKDKVELEMEQHYEKWCGSFEEWHSRFAGFEGFLKSREEIVHSELAELFSLPAAIELAVNVYPAQAATVKLNSIELDSFPFIGSYFTHNEIELTAKPNLGEIFEYWENLRTGERFYTESIRINPEEKDHLVAVCGARDPFEMSIYPNPAEDLLNVNFSMVSTSSVEFQVTDSQGKIRAITDFEDEFTKGGHTIDLDISFLQAGHYILILRTGYGQEIIQFLKL